MKSVPCRRKLENDYSSPVKEMVSNGEDIMESSRGKGKSLVSALTGFSNVFWMSSRHKPTETSQRLRPTRSFSTRSLLMSSSHSSCQMWVRLSVEYLLLQAAAFM